MLYVGREYEKVVTLGLVLAFLGSTLAFAGGGRDSGTKQVVYVARAQADLFAAWLANSIKTEVAKYPNLKVTVVDGQEEDAKLPG